jgi:hypothetical protein
MKILSLLALCVLTISSVASSQTFKQHKIGETAQQFFSTATMSEKGILTTTYCKDYLSDPKVLKAYEKAQRDTFDTRSLIQSSDVKGCREVQEALDGKNVEVGARYAAEVGKGSVTFRASKLVVMAFDLEKGTPLEDVITDISKELGGAQVTMSVDTLQNGFGATLQRRKAMWNANNLSVSAREVKDFQFGDLGIFVVVADAEYFKQKEAERQATRPNTIH